jgi:hypothetical protein
MEKEINCEGGFGNCMESRWVKGDSRSWYEIAHVGELVCGLALGETSRLPLRDKMGWVAPCLSDVWRIGDERRESRKKLDES